MPRVLVIGAGWAGASAARTLIDAGIDVLVVETADVVGGHSRESHMGGVVYEPNGAHIFHTSNPAVNALVRRFGLTRPFKHQVKTALFLDDEDQPLLLSWPLQIDELRSLPNWNLIASELEALEPTPSGDNFADYVTSMMGPTLYSLFIDGYTRKQWGCDPSELSAAFAPKRVELRSDGNRALFRDKWEYFSRDGMGPVIERILEGIEVKLREPVGLTDIVRDRQWSAVIISAALDEFCNAKESLAWRGVALDSTLYPTRKTETRTAGYVVNYPSLRVPYTRTIETKHATGQRIEGTVVSYEIPGSSARHYPVPTVDGRYEALNRELQESIVAAMEATPVAFAGRLATYTYINQDQAIESGIAAAVSIGRQVV